MKYIGKLKNGKYRFLIDNDIIDFDIVDVMEYIEDIKILTREA